MMRSFYISIFLFFSICDLTSAQCTDDCINEIGPHFFQVILDGAFSDRSMGQTFTSCRDGVIDSLYLNLSSLNTVSEIGVTYEVRLDIEPGSGVDNNPMSSSFLSPGSLTTTFTTTATNYRGLVSIQLPTLYPVSNGTKYRFEITHKAGPDRLRVAARNPGIYGDGELVGITGLYSPNADLDFKLTYGEAVPQNVPTISQWGMIILTLILTIFSIRAISFKTKPLL